MLTQYLKNNSAIQENAAGSDGASEALLSLTRDAENIASAMQSKTIAPTMLYTGFLYIKVTSTQ